MRKERGGKEYKQYQDAKWKRANYKRQEDLTEEEKQEVGGVKARQKRAEGH